MSTAGKLAAIAAWLDSVPPDHSRHFTVEMGTHTDAHAVIRLDACWIPRGPASVPEDLRPLQRRLYESEGNTLAEALEQLHVPRATRVKERLRK